jgi:flagellar hook protein FlgE
MTTILGASASGMTFNQGILDTVGNNVANVNTFGFKKTRALAEGQPDATATPDTSRLGVANTTLDLIFNPAATQMTEDPLHFAIQDDTFFRVHDLDGSIAYTRFGQLSADAAGNVTAYGGRFLEPPVTIPDGMTSPQIDNAGVITALDSTGARQQIGQLTMVRFVNPQGLATLGDGLYGETVNSGATTEGTPGSPGFAAIIPGGLEASNVDLAEEFTTMIIAQRAYQASAKSFSVGDEMLAIATDLTK